MHIEESNAFAYTGGLKKKGRGPKSTPTD